MFGFSAWGGGFCNGFFLPGVGKGILLAGRPRRVRSKSEVKAHDRMTEITEPLLSEIGPGGRRSLATLMAGIVLLVPAALGIIRGAPTISCPFPVFTALPSLIFTSRYAGVVIQPLLFFLWNPGLFRGDDKPPMRSFWLLLLAFSFSAYWFYTGWGDGIEYQGAKYVHYVTAINVAWILSLGIIFARNLRRAPSFTMNLVLHWLIFAWLSWYAYPWLGELP